MIDQFNPFGTEKYKMEIVPDTPASKTYNQGLEKLANGAPSEAAKKFADLGKQYPGSDWAQKALLMTTYADYQAGSYTDAETSAERFLKEYPNSPDAAYVTYLRANAYYQQIPDISRDQDSATKAMEAFQDLVKKYPKSEYVEDAKFKIQVTQDQLAGKEMSIGRFYLNRHNYTAAINRFRNVLQYYQTTRHAEEALYRLVEAYLGLGITDEARDGGRGARAQLPRQPVVSGRLRAPEGQRPVAAGELQARGSRRSITSSFRPERGPAMLARLSIRDVVLIDQLDLEFSAGLTILTGETGAGKSILLDALSLALGARGDGGLVRHGSSQGQVTAVFELPPGHVARTVLEGQDIEIGDELILRRVQFADGRTRAYVNDQSVSAQALRSLASALVEIHGQHDERALTDAATHRALIDSYGRLDALAEAVQNAFAALRDAERALEAERSRVAAAEADAEFARHAHDELTRLDVQPGEEEALAARRQTMMQGEKVAADIREARDHLSGEAALLPALLSSLAPAAAPDASGAGSHRAEREGAGRGDRGGRGRVARDRAGARGMRVRSARARALRGAPVRVEGDGPQVRRPDRKPARARAEIRRRSCRPRRRPRGDRENSRLTVAGARKRLP